MYADLEKIVSFTYTCSSGNGGQNVNRRSTKAILRVAVDSLELPESVIPKFLQLAGNRITADGVLIITSQVARTQERNRKKCMNKLRELLVAAAKTSPSRIPSQPSASAKARRLDAKRKHSLKKRNRRQQV